MAKSEDIEAKLAEYVDGRLDTADRAEIEKHLAENPQHRQLIAELSQHRQLLKNLPREHAPGDVAETINAQLERAVLLGDIDGDSHSAGLRIGRGPQIRAIAAVLLLTVGLAAVIYYFLPSPNRQPAEIADLRSPPATPATEMPFALTQEDKDQAVNSPATQPAEALANAAQQTEQERRATFALGERGAANGNSQDAALFGDAAKQQLNGANPALGIGPVVIVIPSADPKATNRQVTDYLTNNKINWQASSEATPKTLEYDQNQIISASRLQQVKMQVKEAPATNSIDSQQEQIAQAPLENQPGNQQTGQFIVARQLPRPQAMALGAALENLNNQQLADISSTLRIAGGAATQPTTMQVAAVSGGATTLPAKDDLSLQSKPLAPTTLPAMPRRIEVGDTLSIRVPQLVGPGVEPQSSQRVEAGGDVSLPMLDQVPVAGMTEGEAAQAIAQKYRDAKLIPDATATVAITSMATTQPAGGLSLAPAPTSQQGDLVDVVIMVKPQPPATQPSTQPATEPTTQAAQ